MTFTPTAIVTGASRGLGLGIAHRLLEAGYHVIAAARTAPELDGARQRRGGRHVPGRRPRAGRAPRAAASRCLSTTPPRCRCSTRSTSSRLERFRLGFEVDVFGTLGGHAGGRAAHGRRDRRQPGRRALGNARRPGAPVDLALTGRADRADAQPGGRPRPEDRRARAGALHHPGRRRRAARGARAGHRVRRRLPHRRAGRRCGREARRRAPRARSGPSTRLSSRW